MEFEFTPSINIMEPHSIAEFMQDLASTDGQAMTTAVEDFLEAVDDNLKNRDDLPADIRVTLERFKIMSEVLLDMVLLTQLEDSEIGHA